MMFGTMGTASEDDQLMSSLLYGLIVYSELWESPPPTETTIQNRFIDATIASYGADVPGYCAFTKDSTSYACTDSNYYNYLYGSYDASPIFYKKDKYWNVAASPPSDVSVLLMSGKLDPQTPHKYAEVLLAALATTNKELVAFDYATHATLWTTPMANSSAPTCGMQILASYVSGGGDLSKMDKSCIAQMPALSFSLSGRAKAKWLNTTDAFDGEYVEGLADYAKLDEQDASNTSSSGSSSSSYKTVFIISIVAFAVAAVVAGVAAIMWIRAKKANTNSLKEVNVYTESTV